MSAPPTYFFHALSSQARQMSRNTKDERMQMILKNVALGSLILMTSFAANQVLKELFGEPDHHRQR